MTDYSAILKKIESEIKQIPNQGEVAAYIPELANVATNSFGMYLNRIHGQNYGVGDDQVQFSIQSISKVFTLAMAFDCLGNDLWNRMDVEPSGNPFNYLALLELEQGIPRNPLINSGAIVVADVLLSNLKDPKNDLLKFIRGLANDTSIGFNEKVAQSEKLTGFKNEAIANLLKSYGNLNNDVKDVLDFYYHQCSIEMNCEQLSNAFYPFANKGVCMQQQQCLTASQAKRINAIMLTCGFYDEAGEFAFEVGLPGKSGVGGGIVALLPDNFIITVWSPALNEKGNSYLGMQALERFTTATKASIF
ncbi:MAG: glutaminase [Flavobacteriaceae bacterium]|nr:glutaminase [Flavobacteriaceae bacterium]